ncbi:hypothetical protein KZ483_03065 [Paenibacillus sp. sptzw28]|uniref:CBO0543 family protein n=1 Tax=Paenibacillus sp. sptzw28 TaxID=715179 RepID=UPI001C6ED1CB|nr:CBO0543 family protein [Paenibacillus sp. sptzw28]QYR22024.1 hypothetical protein KZ483_03065 [Paenibacillus sp. sptzw28]
MHVALAIISLLAAWKWGDWRNWKRYHPAMMYFAMGNLMYHFLCANHYLWRFKPDVLSGHTITEIIYTFVTFPAVALIFLSRYPRAFKKQLFHILQWIVLFAAAEWLLYISDRINYDNGWMFLWSLLFDITMFPMLRLFYQKELVAYSISIGLAIMWIWLFNVPVHVPIELRK